MTEDLATGGARFFTFRDHSGRTADFFVYRESGGATRAALDACRTCARWRKGYRLEGGKMVCIYCGMHYDIDTLAKGIVDRGGTLDQPPTDQEWGMRDFSLTDPDGFKITIGKELKKR